MIYALLILSFVANDFSGVYVSPIGSAIVFLYDAFANGILSIASKVISIFATPAIGVVDMFLNTVLDITSGREAAEYIAYSWYYDKNIWNLFFNTFR